MTHGPGPDIYPAAATDAAGRVWVAWQAFRNGQARIMAARQEGDGFAAPWVVAETPANAWCPAIAATSSQPAEVTIAWDTYAKGDYDVYARTYHGDSPAEPFPVAATQGFEARPAVAYDGNRRLWMAWEQTGPGWGKDYSGDAEDSLTKKGLPLYLQREVQVRVLQNGQWSEPAGDLNALWPKMPRGKGCRNMVEKDRANFVRLGTDRGGRVWLSARVWMGPALFQNWHELVTYAGSNGWAAPIFIAGNFTMLDKRSAMVPDPEGDLLLVGPGSGRQRPADVSNVSGKASPYTGYFLDQQHHGNLYVTPVRAAPDAGPPRLVAVAAPTVAPALPSTEADDVRRVRAYRTQFAGKALRILRGEFHRHTEMSGDGGADGSLEDMWPYALDAASLDWIGNGDHDNGNLEYPWWLTQKTTTIFALGDAFTPMYSYERSRLYPDGHRNPLFRDGASGPSRR